MCGICGFYFKEGPGESRQVVERMNRSLQHRGPDADGFYFHSRIGLGHRRLSIIDLDQKANQPFNSQDNRYSLVFNGEIYNYLQLKKELEKEIEFDTNSDTEVVLAAFIKWGKACLDKLDGMFAFAIWDSLSGQLFIARDRLGIKPLYYFHDQHHFVFASEIRALMQSKVFELKLDHNAVYDFLSYQTVHAPYTILKDVFMLMPGHFILVEGDQVEIKEWWKTRSDHKELESHSKEEWEIKIQECFFQAVEERMIADVPLGAFLSGGIDSTAIVAAMSEISESMVSTFSVVFDEHHYSEDQYSTMVADKFNTRHHRILLKPRDFLENIPTALDAMDHPSGDGINTYTVSEATKNAGITVALSGLGGDELFAGYPVFSQIPKMIKIGSIPHFVRIGIGGLLNTSSLQKRRKAADLISRSKMDLLTLYPEMRRLIPSHELKKLMKGNADPKRLDNLCIDLLQRTDTTAGELADISNLELNSYMQNVLLRDADQFSMAHALEVRVPFLDHQLVDLLLSVPDNFKKGRFPKELLVSSLGNRIPKDIYQRKKMGFVLPWKEWLKTDLKGFIQRSLQELKEMGVFAGEELDSLFADFFERNKEDRWLSIWNLVVLNHWIKKNEIQA